MQARVQKWGNSLAVRIPKPVITETGLGENALVEVSSDGEVITIRRSVRIPTLEELLAGITDENKHELVDWGPDVGKERLDE